MVHDHTDSKLPTLLERIHTYHREHGYCPRPFLLCGGDTSQFSVVTAGLTALERDGAIVRKNPTTWERYDLVRVQKSVAGGTRSRNTIRASKGRGGRDINGVHLYPRDLWLLQQIATWVLTQNTFPGPSDIGITTSVRFSDQDRGHLVAQYARLEQAGVLTRIGGKGQWWKGSGAVSDLGHALLATLPATVTATASASRVRRTGGGLAPDGGTLFPSMLRPAREGIVKLPSKYSKLGVSVTKTNAGGPPQGRRIATYSLEEGYTCSLLCGLRDKCFAGKLSRERRVKYEGLETDEAIAAAIETTGPFHWRLHTVGDFPNEGYLKRVVAALLASGATAWGYTHWTMNDPLGAAIAWLAKNYWGKFSVRLSYEAWGVRPPEGVPAAVVVREFTPEVLAKHNAVPCPEQVQDEGLGHGGKTQINCGNCGLCWTNPEKTIAFKLH